MEIIYFIIIGALAGWLAGLVWKGSGFGLIGNIITGIVGALIGGWVAGQMGWFGDGGFIYQVLIAAAGALVVLLLLKLIRG